MSKQAQTLARLKSDPIRSRVDYNNALLYKAYQPTPSKRSNKCHIVAHIGRKNYWIASICLATKHPSSKNFASAGRKFILIQSAL